MTRRLTRHGAARYPRAIDEGRSPSDTIDLLDEVARRAGPGQADLDADRRQRAAELITIASRRRRPLEQLRSCYLRRLHRDPADFDATKGLRVVDAALTGTPFIESEP